MKSGSLIPMSKAGQSVLDSVTAAADSGSQPSWKYGDSMGGEGLLGGGQHRYLTKQAGETVLN